MRVMLFDNGARSQFSYGASNFGHNDHWSGTRYGGVAMTSWALTFLQTLVVASFPSYHCQAHRRGPLSDRASVVALEIRVVRSKTLPGFNWGYPSHDVCPRTRRSVFCDLPTIMEYRTTSDIPRP